MNRTGAKVIPIPTLVLSMVIMVMYGCDRGKPDGAQETGTQGEAYVLTLSHYGSPNDTVTGAVEVMAERASELSGGRITINIHPNSELGDSNAQLNGTRTGAIDIVVVGNPYYTAFAPELNVLDLPFLFEDEAHAYKVMDGEIGRELLDSLESSNLIGLACYEIGFRDLTNNRNPIKTVTDLAGLKLRTTPNPAHISAFRSWGASPTPMPFKEVYFSLKTGVIDGQENPVHHIHANNLQEVQQYLSLTRHAYTCAPMAMNLDRYKSMDTAMRQVLVQAAVEGAQYERQMNEKKNEESLQALENAGMIVEENPDTDGFRNGVEDAWQGYIDLFGDRILEGITDIR